MSVSDQLTGVRMDEMQLRALAVALRSHLPDLVVEQDVAMLDAELVAGLDRLPGRALTELQRIMVWEAPAPVRDWVVHRLDEQPSLRLRSGTTDGGAHGVDAHEPAVWIEERSDDDLEPLVAGRSYVLVAVASTEGTDARYTDEVTAWAGAGLDTTWVLSSTAVRLEPHPDDPEVHVEEVEAGELTQWQAVFPLRIPADGDSVRHRLRITPASPDARLDIAVLVGDDLFRRLPVTFAVRSAETGETEQPSADEEVVDPVSSVVVGQLRAAHAGLTRMASWQRPERTLQVEVFGGKIAVLTVRGRGVNTKVPIGWATAGDLRPRIANLRSAAQRLREAHPSYFELIEPDQLAADLPTARPEPDWTDTIDELREEHSSAWAVVAASEELYELAFFGHELFTAVFADRKLQEQVAELEPGDGVELSWMVEFAPDVPHLPLPLLYLEPVRSDRPVDPMQFLGLRHRLTYLRRQSASSRALGNWMHTTRAHLLYWGQGPDDSVGAEAARHVRELEQWQPLLVLPRREPRIDDLAEFLGAPAPAPVSLLYFYCHCSDGSGLDPVLRFGPTNDPVDVLRRPRMGSEPLRDEPIVFVNACGSSRSDPQWVNQLMDGFLDRGCRGYIGTEGEVPAGLAARFATTFFSFLYGTPDRVRAPVGEAISQARRLLWQRYRNLGGLFYNYVNDFMIYSADDEEVAELRAAATAAGGER